jgi:hypothetical protein
VSIRVALFLALFCAPAGAAPVTESWSGELDLITTDNPPSLFAGFPLGTPVLALGALVLGLARRVRSAL